MTADLETSQFAWGIILLRLIYTQKKKNHHAHSNAQRNVPSRANQSPSQTLTQQNITNELHLPPHYRNIAIPLRAQIIDVQA